MTRAAIRLRSTIKAHREVKDTLRHLRLNKVNHCVLVPEGKTYDGMLQKVKDFITWGEIKPEVLANMVIKRGRLVGDRPITNQYIKDNTKHESLIKFAEAVASGKASFVDLKDAKPVFRLHPPLRGLEGVKRSFRDHGSLGYRGEFINDLLVKMLDVPSGKKAAVKPEAPKPKAPIAMKAKPAPKTVPVAKKAEPIPKKAEAAPKKAPVAKKAEPVPKKAEAAPKKAPVAKKAEPVPKKAPVKMPKKEESQ